ncbi:MAG TPA: DUF2306 domain-containing protein [Pyrinomonadaceae bacterium]|nr:DUF2306 domain-containing protein [Pyrinomonadaceae bacterium]
MNDAGQKLQVKKELTPTSKLAKIANASLNTSVKFWFITAAIGQLLFVVYLLGLYGRGAFRGDLEVLNKVMPKGYVAGDLLGNIAVSLHIFFAVIIISGGLMQIIPQLRERFPIFHRWNGRIFVLIAFILSFGGLYMVWVRGSVGDVTQHLGISLNAFLIMFFSAMTLKNALNRKFALHRKWSLRLFMAASGVWFFRVGLMFWVFANKGPVGFNPDTFQGPFLTFWATADSLLPLAVLELYLRSAKFSPTNRLLFSTLVFILTILMGIGIFVAFFGLWLPKL